MVAFSDHFQIQSGGNDCGFVEAVERVDAGARLTHMPRYSIVIPVYNEADALSDLCERLAALMDSLDGDAEVLFVDDGSTDDSFVAMRATHEHDPRFRVVRLSRNFGHQVAITAGLDHARGDAVVIMDADLQDPPEVVLEMVKRWHEGFRVVYAVREQRPGEGLAKRLTAKWFYRMFARLTDFPAPLDTGDFRLVDRTAVDVIRSMRENRRYLRGMFAWIGFDQTGVRYVRGARTIGQSKFSLRRMANLAIDGLLSFSAAPLRATLKLGLMVSAISFFGGVLTLVCGLTGVYSAPSWISIALGIAFVGGAQLTVLGIIGEYIARIYDEVKQRPLYVVHEELGAATARPAATTVSAPIATRTPTPAPPIGS